MKFNRLFLLLIEVAVRGCTFSVDPHSQNREILGLLVATMVRIGLRIVRKCVLGNTVISCDLFVHLVHLSNQFKCKIQSSPCVQQCHIVELCGSSDGNETFPLLTITVAFFEPVPWHLECHVRIHIGIFFLSSLVDKISHWEFRFLDIAEAKVNHESFKFVFGVILSSSVHKSEFKLRHVHVFNIDDYITHVTTFILILFLVFNNSVH